MLAFGDAKPMQWWGVFQYYKDLSDALMNAGGAVRLIVPIGISHVQTFSGARVTVGEDRVIEVSRDDAGYFERQGWKRAEAAE